MLNSSEAYGAEPHELLGVQNEQLILLCVIFQVKISFIIVYLCLSGSPFIEKGSGECKAETHTGFT